MAKGVKDLMGDEVEITLTEPSARSAQTGGVLVDTDDRGVLLSAEDPTDGPIRVFVPWTAIAWIRAIGKYEPPQRRSMPKPQGL